MIYKEIEGQFHLVKFILSFEAVNSGVNSNDTEWKLKHVNELTPKGVFHSLLFP